MTEDEVDELVAASPTLYHMAERGSWDSIRDQGLLSTTALLDTYGISGQQREAIERRHRNTSVPISAPGQPGAVIRDQLPMSDAGLVRALPPGISPSDWYALLNSKVFFWLSKERLFRLINAKTYRNKEHDILEVDARSLITKHHEDIWLCPINSGCTKPFPHPRDASIFRRVNDYPYAHWSSRRSATERVVELAVDYAVLDIAAHTKRVVAMKGDSIVKVLYTA